MVKRLFFKDLKLLGLEDTALFFMYVHQEGIPDPDTPCCCNKEVTIAVAANLYPIYNRAIKFLDGWNNDCNSNNKE